MNFIVATDFDGTLVEHKFPDIGKPVPEAFDWLKRFKEAGAKLILWTMRSDGQAIGPVLKEAVDFCRTQGIEFWAVNDNPEQVTWTSSRKVYCHQFIDDANAGCPLIASKEMGARPMVDWSKVGPAVMEMIEAKQ